MDVASAEGLVAVHAVVNEERVYMLINRLKPCGGKGHSRHGHPTDGPLIKMKIFPADILGGRCVQSGAGKTGERDGVWRSAFPPATRWLNEGATGAPCCEP